MVLCYEPVKNIDFLESKFGKTTFLVHSKDSQRINTNKTPWQYKKIKNSKFGFRGDK